MGSTKTWIATASHKLGDRFAMAVGSEPETELVFSHAEWVDLALGVEFDSRTVGFESKDVAAGEFDCVTIGTLEFGDVIEAVASIDPTVVTITQGIDHAVSIAGSIEGTEDDLAMVTDSIAVGIAKEIDVGDGKGDHSVLVGEQTDGDIQAIGKGGLGFERAVLVFVFEHDDCIGQRLVLFGGEGVQNALGKPQSAFGIEGKVHRLSDEWFASDEFDLEACRDMKAGQFIRRRVPWRATDRLAEPFGGRLRFSGFVCRIVFLGSSGVP